MIKNALITILVVAAIVCFVYGMFWVAKTVSYKVFYEDMVKAEIVDMVKPECVR